MKTILLYSLLAFVLLASKCDGDNKTNSSSREAESTETAAEEISNDMNQTPSDTCRFIVSFYSIGEGADFRAKEEFDKYLDTWNGTHESKVDPEQIPWGREGEVDFCFKLADMEEAEQQEFVDGMKTSLKDSKLIHYYEYQPSPNRR